MSREEKRDFLESLQSKTTPTTSWGDVARASADKAEMDRAAAAVFPGGSDLQAGDWVDHPTYGRCLVHKIVHPLVHMAPENFRVVRLSLDVISFSPSSVEDGRRVFTISQL